MAREQVTTVPRRQATNNGACSRDAPGPTNSLPLRGGRAAPSPLLWASARFRRQARKRVTGMARPCAHNAARPHLPPVPVLARRGTPAPAAGLHSTRVLSLSIRTSTTVTCSKRHHIPVRAGGVSGELAPSTPVPVGKRNLAVRSPHARTSRRRKRHRVSFFGPARRVYNGVFQSATLALNDLFAFLNILYCPRL